MTSDGRRARRVAELLRTHLTAALAREVGDPRLASVVVTGVEVPDDLGLARIHVRLLIGDDGKARGALLKVLSGVAPRLRRGLAPRLGLRRVPELRFDYDTGPDASERVAELLREIESEPRGKPE